MRWRFLLSGAQCGWRRAGDSIDEILETVDRLNRPDARGQRKVRIRAIGFPTIFSPARLGEATAVRFATLMARLLERHAVPKELVHELLAWRHPMRQASFDRTHGLA